MDKTSQKVTKDKDPKLVEADHKGRWNYMKEINKDILNDAKKDGRDTTKSSNETASSATNSGNETTSVPTTRSNDTYIYGVGIIAVLAIGVCVFFAYNTSQPKNKKQANEKKDQPQKRLHVFKKTI